jgi:hypothetical protein
LNVVSVTMNERDRSRLKLQPTTYDGARRCEVA